MSKKIFYNLVESNFIVDTGKFVYYFSSLFNVKRFVDNLSDNREDITYKLSSRYNIKLHTPDYCDFILYSNVEKRGFRIFDKRKGVWISCLNEVKLNGEIATLQNSNESLKILTPK